MKSTFVRYVNRKDLCNRFLAKVAVFILMQPIINKIYMAEQVVSFDSMPQMMAVIIQKLESLEAKVDHLTLPKQEEEDEWFNVKGLCNYLPNHPAEQTVYGWTSNHFIPFHKKGKNIAFRKSEIDTWLYQGMKKSFHDIQREAEEFVNNKRKKGGWQ